MCPVGHGPLEQGLLALLALLAQGRHVSPAPLRGLRNRDKSNPQTGAEPWTGSAKHFPIGGGVGRAA